MKKLYRFSIDFCRMGKIDGIFVATHDELLAMCGHEIYFGEVLGRHSDIDCTFSEGDFEVVTYDQAFIEKVQEFDLCTVGFNPVETYQEQVDDGCYDGDDA